MGDSKLGAIDLERNQFEVINELGGFGKLDPLCHCAVSCEDGRKIASLTIKKQTGHTYLNFWSKGCSNVTTKPITYLDKDLENLISLEISSDRSVLFAAGESNKGGSLIAISNDKYFDFICKEEF